MKKLLLSLIAFITLLVPALIIAETTGGGDGAINTADFSKFAITSTYSTYTTGGENPWVATNAQILGIIPAENGDFSTTTKSEDISENEFHAVVLNGKTSNVGVLTSPVIAGGIKTLSFTYGNPYAESNGVSITIELKSGETVVKSETFTKTNDEVGKLKPYEASFTFDCPDDVEIVITNNCPSNNSTSNKDRIAIWNLQWTGFTAVEGEVYFSPAAGVLHNPAEIALSCGTEGAKIFYTTDGTDPTDESTEYTAPIEVSSAMTIKAKVEGNATISSAEYSFATAEPAISNEGSNYSDHTITITSATEGAKIYYTTDGTEPTEESAEYSEPFTISTFGTTTVKAIAVSDFGSSAVASTDVKITSAGYPTFTPEAGTYPEAIDVVITSTTSEAKIYYTTDGSEPTEESDEYTAPIAIDRSTTVKAIAIFEGQTAAAKIIEAAYKIDATVKEITFDFTNFSDADLDWAGIDQMPDEGNNDNNGWVVDEFEKDGLTVTFDNSSATNAAQSYRLWYNKGVQLRLAKGGANDASTMTFTAPEGSKITTIIFTGNNSYFSYNASTGKIEKEESHNVWTWTGVAESIVFTPHDFGGTMQLTSIAVTCSESNAPIFNYETGTYYQDLAVTMTTDLPGGKIYYTTDGTEPTAESTEYTEPVTIAKGEPGTTSTVKAIAVGERLNPINGLMEDYVSEVSEAVYTWAEIDNAGDTEIITVQQLINWFTTAEEPENLAEITDPAKIQWVYPNIDKVIEYNNGLTVTAVTPHALYLDDTYYNPEEINSIILTSSAVDFTELYKPNDVLNAPLVVGFEWINEVTPSLTLKGNPAELYPYVTDDYVPETVTVDEILASTAWNQADIDLDMMNNEWSTKHDPQRNIMVPRIALDNPLLVSRLVKVEGLNVTKDITANMSKAITCVSPDGKEINIVTDINIGEYTAGKYDMEAIVAYDVKFTEQKVNNDGYVTTPADTTITTHLIPVRLFGDSGSVDKAVFTPTEEVSEGYILLVADNHAMTALPFNKTYGYAPATKVKDENGELLFSTDDALRLVAVGDDMLSRSADDRYFIMDSYGRYYYQTGTFNSFNVNYELPEIPEEAMWTLEATDDEEGVTCMKVTNVATEKWIQYSSKYGSWGCYPEDQDQAFLPVAYQTDATPSGLIEISPAVGTEAPAEVFTLQGIRLGSALDGLTPGIYIVRRGSSVSKVLVR